MQIMRPGESSRDKAAGEGVEQSLERGQLHMNFGIARKSYINP
jgi:hypothetical protein